jgi:hypothetical protein
MPLPIIRASRKGQPGQLAGIIKTILLPDFNISG